MLHVRIEVILLYFQIFFLFFVGYFFCWNIRRTVVTVQKFAYREKCSHKGEVRFLLLFDLHANGNINTSFSDD